MVHSFVGRRQNFSVVVARRRDFLNMVSKMLIAEMSSIADCPALATRQMLATEPQRSSIGASGFQVVDKQAEAIGLKFLGI